MNDNPKVKKGDYIRMIASIAGDVFSWAPGQVLLVGKHIEPDMATALVTMPPDDPRAERLDEAEARRLLGEQAEAGTVDVPSANEIPPARPDPDAWLETRDSAADHIEQLEQLDEARAKLE